MSDTVTINKCCAICKYQGCKEHCPIEPAMSNAKDCNENAKYLVSCKNFALPDNMANIIEPAQPSPFIPQWPQYPIAPYPVQPSMPFPGEFWYGSPIITAGNTAVSGQLQNKKDNEE